LAKIERGVFIGGVEWSGLLVPGVIVIGEPIKMSPDCIFFWNESNTNPASN
jgi:hypothetical protein